MELSRIRGNTPLARATGSRFRISVQLTFENASEMETMYRKGGVPLGTKTLVLGSVYLDLDGLLMQEPYITLVGRDGNGRRFETNVPTSRLWKGALEATRSHVGKMRLTGRTA